MICYICKKPIYVSKPISHGVTFEANKTNSEGKKVGESYHFSCKYDIIEKVSKFNK